MVIREAASSGPPPTGSPALTRVNDLLDDMVKLDEAHAALRDYAEGRTDWRPAFLRIDPASQVIEIEETFGHSPPAVGRSRN